MQRAITLARQALGTTSPNPAVGAVVVKDGVVLGEGFTLPVGQRHAEVGALDQAGDAARGATLYSSLEPCCNYGRTPPCTRVILKAGIRSVHFALIDPNPRVSGRGHADLEVGGIEVVAGEEAEEARELYEAFDRHINTGLPFVSAKYAMSLDGKIATHTGDSKWVTGPEARQRVQRLRKESDAVMVGINTVLADDPQLTARDGNGDPLPGQPLRVVLDSRLRTPPGARLLREPGHTLIATSVIAAEPSGQERAARLEEAGAEVMSFPSGPGGLVEIRPLLEELGQRGIVSLLVEGGGGVLGSLFDAGLVDKVYAFIAPVVIGGSAAASPVAGAGVSRMADAWRLKQVRAEQAGPDLLVVGYPAGAGESP